MVKHQGYIFIAQDGQYLTLTNKHSDAPIEWKLTPYLENAKLFPDDVFPTAGSIRYLMKHFEYLVDDTEGMAHFVKRYFTAVAATSIQSIQIGPHA